MKPASIWSVAALCGWVGILIFGGMPEHISMGAAGNVLYLAVWSHVPNDIVIPVASPPNRYPLSILCHFFIVARAVITPAAEKRAATIKDALNSFQRSSALSVSG